MAGSPTFLALLDEMRDLHIRKNAGYAGDQTDPWANFRMCEEFGIPIEDGVLTRMSDKWSRLRSLWVSKGENDKVGESLEDTLIDLGSYAFILVCILREFRQQGGILLPCLWCGADTCPGGVCCPAVPAAELEAKLSEAATASGQSLEFIKQRLNEALVRYRGYQP